MVWQSVDEESNPTQVIEEPDPGRILLDSRLVDLKRLVMLDVDGRGSRVELRPSLRVLCATLLDRGDIGLAFTAEVQVARERSF